MASKVILITGSNSGIGYEALKVFLNAPKSYHILAAARSDEKASRAVASARRECPGSKNTIEPITVDVTSDHSIEQAYMQVVRSPGRLDVLLNNAGATFDLDFVAGRMSLRDCFNRAYDVNVTGANVMAWTFMPLLLKSADPRLIFVAGLSMMTVVNNGPYFPTPPQPAGWPKKIDFETIGYRCSKTALNMLTLDWAHKLKEDGVKVFGVGPGMLATNLGNARDGPGMQATDLDYAKKLGDAMGAGHAREGGELFLKVIEGDRDDHAGKVINKNGLSAL